MKGSIKKYPTVFPGNTFILCIVIALAILPLRRASGSANSTEPASSHSSVTESKPRMASAATVIAEVSADAVAAKRGASKFAKPKGLSVFGIIRDGKGRPVADAVVQAAQVDAGARRYDATSRTMEDGRYELKGLHVNNPFPYKIVASAPGYAPTSSSSFALVETPREVNITLSKGVSVSGRITTADGKAIEAATLNLMESSIGEAYWIFFYTDFDGVLTATTNSEGDYSFPHVVPGEYWLYIRAKTYIDVVKLFTISPEDEAVNMKFTMDYAGDLKVSGVVVDEKSGEPIQGVRVQCRQYSVGKNRNREIHRTCFTNAEGKFALEGFQDRHQAPQICLTKMGYIRSNPNIKVGEEVRAPLKRLYLSDMRGTIPGRVYDSVSSQPVTRFAVAVLRPEDGVYFWGDRTYCAHTQTFESPDGTFEIENIENGRVYLLVSAPGYATKKISAFSYPADTPEEKKRAFEIGLESGATITGTAYEKETGDPIAGARVTLDYDWQESGITPCCLSAYTDEKGRYRLDGVPTGQQYLLASHPGYAPALSKNVELLGGKTYQNVDFFLGPGGCVEGRIVDPNMQQGQVKISFQLIDSPVLLQKVGHVHFENRFLGPPRAAQTDEHGRYRLEGLTPGYHLVRAQIFTDNGRAGWFVPVNEVMEVVEGKTTAFDIPICEGGQIKGTIIPDPSFEPSPGPNTTYNILLRNAGAPDVDASDPDALIVEMPIRRDGPRYYTGSPPHRFSFRGICPGDYTITVLAFKRTPARYREYVDQISVPVKVRQNGETKVEIDFKKPGMASWIEDTYSKLKFSLGLDE